MLKSGVKGIFFGVFLLFIIAGCSRVGDEISLSNPFLGGTNGLEIKFLKDAPPDEVTDGGVFPFDSIVSITNIGEHGLTTANVRVALSGFRAQDFGTANLIGKLPEENPTAKKKDSEGNIIDAIETIASFSGLNMPANIIKGNTIYNFRADVCYNYQTKALTQICVLNDLINVDGGAICDPRGSKRIFSSASPLQVTNFKQSVAGGSTIQFSFDIVHAGSGKVFQDETFSGIVTGCPESATDKRTKQDKVKFEVKTGLTGDNQKLKCADIPFSITGVVQGEVKLVNGKRTISCTQGLAGGTDFEKNIDITLDFNYLDSVEKNVLVKHLLGATGTTITSTSPSSGGASGASAELKSCEGEPPTGDGDANTKCLAELCFSYNGGKTFSANGAHIENRCSNIDTCLCDTANLKKDTECTGRCKPFCVETSGKFVDDTEKTKCLTSTCEDYESCDKSSQCACSNPLFACESDDENGDGCSIPFCSKGPVSTTTICKENACDTYFECIPALGTNLCVCSDAAENPCFKTLISGRACVDDAE